MKFRNNFTLSLATFVALVALMFQATNTQAATNDCTSAQARVDALSKDIQRDMQAIRNLGFSGISEEDFKEWTDAAESSRKEAVNSLLSGLISLLAVTAETSIIKGRRDFTHSKAKAVKTWLEDQAQAIPQTKKYLPRVKEYIDDLANAQARRASAEAQIAAVKKLSKFADVYLVDKSLTSRTILEGIGMFLGWGAKSPEAGLIIAAANFIASLAYSAQGRLIIKPFLEKLSRLSEQQLRDLNQRTERLRKNTMARIQAKVVLANCENPSTNKCLADTAWEACLQGVRLEASPEDLPELIRQHREIYRQRGIDPSTSPFWPYDGDEEEEEGEGEAGGED